MNSPAASWASMPIPERISTYPVLLKFGSCFENTDYLMASGIAGSLDDAFRGATINLVRWAGKEIGAGIRHRLTTWPGRLAFASCSP